MNKQGFQAVGRIIGDDDQDTALLQSMTKAAQDYITSFSWCPKISSTELAYGVGGVIALFLFEFEKKIHGTDDSLWVVVGDLPSAYLVVEPDDSPKEAIERYCILMEGWISAVLSFTDRSKVFPVNIDPTPKNADLLRRRIDFLRAEIMPQVSS